MTNKSKKAQREEAIKTEKQRRVKLRKEVSPINQEQMLSLVEYVGGKVISNGHTNNLNYASQWAHKNGIDFDELSSFLNSEKIHDDFSLFCEGDPYELFGETDERLSWMPLARDEFNELMDFLDKKLPSHGCNNDFKLTKKWLKTKDYDTPIILAALLAKGGGCDCEITFNVDEEGIYPDTTKFPAIQKQEKPLKKKIKRPLMNPFDWDLSNLPPPWKISNLYDHDAPITLQFGKKSDLKLIFLTTQLPKIETKSDSYWAQQWLKNYPYLDNGSQFTIARNQLSLPSGFCSILIKSQGWMPIICWITLAGINGHIEMKTETRRLAGDIKEVEKLIFDLHE